MSNKENMEVSENVDVLSDSEKKLRDGLEKVNKIAEIAKDNWEKKKRVQEQNLCVIPVVKNFHQQQA